MSTSETYILSGALSGYSPFTVSLDPRNIEALSGHPIHQIVYDFGDNTTYTAMRKFKSPEILTYLPFDGDAKDESFNISINGNPQITIEAYGVKSISDELGRNNKAYAFGGDRGKYFVEELIGNSVKDPVLGTTLSSFDSFRKETTNNLICAYTGTLRNFPVSAATLIIGGHDLGAQINGDTFSLTAISGTSDSTHTPFVFALCAQGGTNIGTDFNRRLASERAQRELGSIQGTLSTWEFNPLETRASIEWSTGVWNISASQPGFTDGVDTISATALRDGDFVYANLRVGSEADGYYGLPINTKRQTISYRFMLTGANPHDMFLYSWLGQLDGQINTGTNRPDFGEFPEVSYHGRGGSYIDAATNKLFVTESTYESCTLSPGQPDSAEGTFERWDTNVSISSGVWYNVTEVIDRTNADVSVHINGVKASLDKIDWAGWPGDLPVRPDCSKQGRYLMIGRRKIHPTNSDSGKPGYAPTKAYAMDFSGVMSNFIVYNDLADDPSDPYLDDPGDPRNEVVTHKYNRTIFDQPSAYKISISAVECNTFSTMLCTVTANIFIPGLIGTDDKNQFTSVHLVKSRVFNVDNLMMYTFETEGTNYLTSVLFDAEGNYLP